MSDRPTVNAAPPVVRTAPAAPAADDFQLALYYQRSGDFEQALLHYRAALQRDEMNVEAHNNLGQPLSRQGAARRRGARVPARASRSIRRYTHRPHQPVGGATSRLGRFDAAAARGARRAADRPAQPRRDGEPRAGPARVRPGRRRAGQPPPRPRDRSAQRRRALQSGAPVRGGGRGRAPRSTTTNSSSSTRVPNRPRTPPTSAPVCRARRAHQVGSMDEISRAAPGRPPLPARRRLASRRHRQRPRRLRARRRRPRSLLGGVRGGARVDDAVVARARVEVARTRSGSSAERSTPASTASIATSAVRGATRPPSSGKGSRAIAGR